MKPVVHETMNPFLLCFPYVYFRNSQLLCPLGERAHELSENAYKLCLCMGVYMCTHTHTHTLP